MTIILIDNYDSFTFNLYQMVQAQTSETVRVLRNNALTYSEIMTLAPSRFILSPGPGHPDIPEDFGVCADLIDQYGDHGLPLLGVCLGHQGLASRFGGRVERAPSIMHGKTSPMDILAASPLFDGLTNPFEAMRYHSLVVAEESLPSCFQLLARDRDHGLVMAIAHREFPLYGVQFHPESIGTPKGARLLGNFLTHC